MKSSTDECSPNCRGRARVFDRCEWDIDTDDGVLIPDRVIDVEETGLATNLDAKDDSLVESASRNWACGR